MTTTALNTRLAAIATAGNATAPAAERGAFGTLRVTVGDGEMAVVSRRRRFERLLGPGSYRLWDPRGEVAVQRSNVVASPRYAGADAELLRVSLGAQLDTAFTVVDVAADEVALVSWQGRVREVLAPLSRALYWRAGPAVAVERVAVAADVAVPSAVYERLRQAGLEAAVTRVEVATEQVGLVSLDGVLQAPLPPGLYAYWNGIKAVKAELVDCRLRVLEVGGQEILTRDKVSLRLNLSLSYRVVDAVRWKTAAAKAEELLYREAQLLLRRAVGTRPLDELLADKAALDGELTTGLAAVLPGLGAALASAGVKDVILPGEMKDILNAVVQAEKVAQANVIRRREETAATRAQLNTAKLLEDNPLTLRLKELETLERVTDKVGSLTVYGGLESLLGQVVKLKP